MEDLPSPDGSIFNDKEAESESELTPVPLVEERLNVSKNEVMYREAKLIKEPIIETETVEVPVTYEELIVERRPASKRTYSAHNLKPPVISRVEIRIPLRKEEIEVKKESYVKELVIKKRRTDKTRTIIEALKSRKLSDISGTT